MSIAKNEYNKSNQQIILTHIFKYCLRHHVKSIILKDSFVVENLNENVFGSIRRLNKKKIG